MPFYYRITLFTPTYNRAYILDRLYRSVQRQSFRDFEWLIIDDGSTDNTEELVQGWIEESNDFPIRYYKVPNGGKCRAINKALELARGELFFTVDSDDYLTDDALSKINAWEKSLPAGGKFCALAGNMGDLSGVPINAVYEEPYLDVSFWNRKPEFKPFVGYDRPWVFYTFIHRAYKYPEFSNETFMREAVAWNRMANEGYRIRCFNDVIYLFEHQSDGYTEHIHSILADNPKGYGLEIRETMRFLQYGLWRRFQTYYAFYCDLRHRYSCDQISGFIGAPKWLFFLIERLFLLKHGVKQ